MHPLSNLNNYQHFTNAIKSALAPLTPFTFLTSICWSTWKQISDSISLSTTNTSKWSVIVHVLLFSFSFIPYRFLSRTIWLWPSFINWIVFASTGSQTFLFLVYSLDILQISLLLAVTMIVRRLSFTTNCSDQTTI